MTEVWRAVGDWPYEVSDLGRVRRTTARTNTREGRILRPSPVTAGRLAVTLSAAGRKRIVAPVHLLVCAAFHGPRPSHRHQAAHRDGDHLNNASANLYWATPEENEADKRRHGRSIYGARHPLAKLDDAAVREIIRRLRSGERRASLAAGYRVSLATIDKIATGRGWMHIAR